MLTDAGLINTGVGGSLGGGGGSAIYTGGVDPTGGGVGETASGVEGKTTNNVGDPVCTSGAYSGERCDLDIVNTDAMWAVPYSNGTVVLVHGLQIESPNQTNAGGVGDSGAPVCSYVDAGLIRARGIISTGDLDTQTLCTGVLTKGNNPNSQPRICTWRIFAPDINTILSPAHFSNVALNLEP
jgi:hypothetical protein